MDEVAARAIAQGLGLRYTGTLGVLLKAKAAGLIPAIRPLLERLIEQAFYLSEALSREMLFLAGE
jgi:predicted nucleic acid-binding protein